MFENMRLEALRVDDHQAVASLIGSKQYEYEQQGLDKKSARKKATNDVGELFEPPVTGAEVESKVGQLRAQLKAGRQPDNGDQQPMTVIYRIWIEQNDFVIHDKQLAHFTGKTEGCFHYARKILAEEGFVLENVGTGWNVVSRPKAEKVYSEKEVRVMMSELTEQLMSKYGK
jgi:hypothetical protein